MATIQAAHLALAHIEQQRAAVFATFQNAYHIRDNIAEPTPEDVAAYVRAAGIYERNEKMLENARDALKADIAAGNVRAASLQIVNLVT